MIRPLLLAALKYLGEALLITVFVSIVVVIIGYFGKWGTTLEYSNAFFIAACIVIIAGASSRVSAGHDWNRYQGHMESFSDLSPSERAALIVNASSSMRLVILGFSSGILLIIISLLVPKLF